MRIQTRVYGRKLFITLCMICVLLAGVTSVYVYGQFATSLAKTGLSVSAHRGNSHVAPENTLATYRQVLAMQVNYIEIDVRTTKDGQLVVLHDATLDRTTNGHGAISDYTLDELKKLSAGKGFDTSFQHERIPTLNEVCQLLADWNARHSPKTNLYVDCKNVAPAPLVSMLKAYVLLNDAVFYGSDSYLAELRNVAPTAKLMPSLKKVDDMVEKINKLHPYAFDVNWNVATEILVRQIHEQGVQVFTDLLDANDTSEHYRKAFRIGVDVIQTDHVQHVYATLNTKQK